MLPSSGSVVAMMRFAQGCLGPQPGGGTTISTNGHTFERPAFWSEPICAATCCTLVTRARETGRGAGKPKGPVPIVRTPLQWHHSRILVRRRRLTAKERLAACIRMLALVALVGNDFDNHPCLGAHVAKVVVHAKNCTSARARCSFNGWPTETSSRSAERLKSYLELRNYCSCRRNFSDIVPVAINDKSCCRERESGRRSKNAT